MTYTAPGATSDVTLTTTVNVKAEKKDNETDQPTIMAVTNRSIYLKKVLVLVVAGTIPPGGRITAGRPGGIT